MNKFIFLAIGIIILIIVVIAFIRSPSTTSASRNNDSRGKSLKYGDITLTSGRNIAKTSNGLNKIVYSTTSGIREYDIESGLSRLLNVKNNVTSLAYDSFSENYLVLDENGKLFNLNNSGDLTLYGNNETTYKALYDTELGYYIRSDDGNFSYIGGFSQRSNGIYNDIILTTTNIK